MFIILKLAIRSLERYNCPNIIFILPFRKSIETTNNEKEYSNILFSLLSFQSVDVVLHTYLALNNTMKKIFNHLNTESKKIDWLIQNLLCTNVLNEIICFGCNNSNKQVFFKFFFFLILIPNIILLCVIIFRYVNQHQKL